MLTFFYSIKPNLTFSFISLILLLISSLGVKSQHNIGQFNLEITKAKIGLNAGPYRGRTAETNGPFNEGFAVVGQVYFPFQWVIDYKSKLEKDTIITDEYNQRKFLIRPSVLFHVIDEGSIAFGIATQFSFLIVKDFYLEYQLGGVYLEAASANHPDLNDGFNLHHTVSISKPVSRHFSVALSIVHFSGAQLQDNQKGSNQDVIALGLKWNL